MRKLWAEIDRFLMERKWSIKDKLTYEFAQGSGAGDAGAGSAQSAPSAYDGGQGTSAVQSANAPGHVSAPPAAPNVGQTAGAASDAKASGSDQHSGLQIDDSLLRNVAAAGLMAGLMARRAKKDEQSPRKEEKKDSSSEKDSSSKEEKKDSSREG